MEPLPPAMEQLPAPPALPAALKELRDVDGRGLSLLQELIEVQGDGVWVGVGWLQLFFKYYWDLIGVMEVSMCGCWNIVCCLFVILFLLYRVELTLCIVFCFKMTVCLLECDVSRARSYSAGMRLCQKERGEESNRAAVCGGVEVTRWLFCSCFFNEKVHGFPKKRLDRSRSDG